MRGGVRLNYTFNLYKGEADMPARKPEDCDIHLMEAMNRGDLEAAVSLYEPNATFVQEPSGPCCYRAGTHP